MAADDYRDRRKASEPEYDDESFPAHPGVEIEERDAVDAWRLVEYYERHYDRVVAYLENTGSMNQTRETRLLLKWIARLRPSRRRSTGRDITRAYPSAR